MSHPCQYPSQYRQDCQYLCMKRKQGEADQKCGLHSPTNDTSRDRSFQLLQPQVILGQSKPLSVPPVLLHLEEGRGGQSTVWRSSPSNGASRDDRRSSWTTANNPNTVSRVSGSVPLSMQLGHDQGYTWLGTHHCSGLFSPVGIGHPYMQPAHSSLVLTQGPHTRRRQPKCGRHRGGWRTTVLVKRCSSRPVRRNTSIASRCRGHSCALSWAVRAGLMSHSLSSSFDCLAPRAWDIWGYPTLLSSSSVTHVSTTLLSHRTRMPCIRLDSLAAALPILQHCLEHCERYANQMNEIKVLSQHLTNSTSVIGTS